MPLEELSRTGRAGVLVAVVVLLCFILLGLAEVGVRVRHWVKYDNLRSVEDTFAVDESSGLRRPIAGLELGGIKINGLGFRSPEIDLRKADGMIRLAFLGGSTTYCAEVKGNENTWPHLVTQMLDAHVQEAQFDYVNAGVPGYGSASSLKHYIGHVRQLDPDVVFIYHGTNDLANNSRKVLAALGHEVANTTSELSWIAEYSLFAFLVEKNIRLLALEHRSLDDTGKFKLEPEQFSEPFRESLGKLVRQIRADGRIAVVVTFSQRLREGISGEEKVDAAQTYLYFTPYLATDNVLSGLTIINQVAREVAASHDAVLVGNEDSIPSDAVHFTDSVHFTTKGSAEMARRVFNGVVENGLPEIMLKRLSASGQN